MRIRAAVTAVAITILALTGLAAPALAVAPLAHTQLSPDTELGAGWRYIGSYTTNGRCIDAGQQFQREGAIREWRCRLDTGSYPPYILQGR